MSREGPHVLFCAFAEVPGPTAAGVRTAQLMGAFDQGFDVDGLCLKGPEVAHIERLGAVRVMRVPVENKGFLERLAAYQRALGRQLAGDRYELVWCADLFSAAVAASYKEAHGFALVVDVADVPSESFARRYDVDAKDTKRRAEWSQAEKAAFRSATLVIAPSRAAAKALVGRVDPSKVVVLPRAVDRERFRPPSVEVALDGRRTVLVVGGREGGPLLGPSVKILAALAKTTTPEQVQLAFAGAPPSGGDDPAREALRRARLETRVSLVDTDGAVAMANVLAGAHVVVVPSLVEAGVDALAIPHRALEAMAAQRPTVLTGAPGGFSDTIVPGEDVLVVPAGDPAAVASAVSKLLDAPALREAVAQSGARRVEHEADLQTRLEQVRVLLRERLGLTLAARPESTAPGEGAESSSSVFTDEPYSIMRVAPRTPPAPAASARVEREAAAEPAVQPAEVAASAAAPVASAVPAAVASEPARERVVDAASSAEGALVEETRERSELSEPAPPVPAIPGEDDRTLIAPPPEGLEDVLVTPSADDWYGDTYLEPAGAFEIPTPVEERAKGNTPTRLAPDQPTSTAPPGSRSLTAEPLSLPDGDPWGYDTIADARPVFTSEDGGRKTPPPARTVAVEVPGRSFLVDPERERTMDEAKLPRELSSSDG